MWTVLTSHLHFISISKKKSSVRLERRLRVANLLQFHLARCPPDHKPGGRAPSRSASQLGGSNPSTVNNRTAPAAPLTWAPELRGSNCPESSSRRQTMRWCGWRSANPIRLTRGAGCDGLRQCSGLLWNVQNRVKTLPHSLVMPCCELCHQVFGRTDLN